MINLTWDQWNTVAKAGAITFGVIGGLVTFVAVKTGLNKLVDEGEVMVAKIAEAFPQEEEDEEA